jgi:hypothetical protein
MPASLGAVLIHRAETFFQPLQLPLRLLEVLPDPSTHLGIAGQTLALALQQLLRLPLHGMSILQAGDEDRASMSGGHGIARMDAAWAGTVRKSKMPGRWNWFPGALLAS